jgi:predicted alpha/beta superfamily hydrolase
MPEVTLPDTTWRMLSHASAPYVLKVAWPSTPPPSSGFPVIYLLDGHVSFATTVECIRARSHRPDATAVPPAVVVGLSLDPPRDRQRRTWDFTPASLQPPDDDEVPDGTSIGGAGAFLTFLESEVMQPVEREWPVDPTRRTLLGHSLSGFFVLHALFSRPALCDAWVAASPSIWWDPAGVLGRATSLAAALTGPAPRVLLTAGEFEEAPAPWQPADTWTADAIERRRRRQMVSHVTRLGQALAPVAIRGGAVRTLVFPGEDHASVVPLTINQALRFGPGRV